MKKVGFIGAYDKTDIILNIAKVLTLAGKKVLVVDNTITQKCKYIVPVINPTRTYVTSYEEIDVAVGFSSIDNLKQYLGLDENESLDYDYMIVDTDSFEGVAKFGLQGAEKDYFVTGFDAYSLKKGIEILSQLGVPTRVTKIFFSKDMLKEEEDYFDYLSLGIKAIWNEEKLYFLLENGDLPATIENQRLSKIRLRNMSNEYRENIAFLVNDIDKDIGDKKIKSIIKEL